MRKLILTSAAALVAIAVPAEAQDLGTIITSVIGGGYSNGYQPYGYQPTYNYQPAYSYQPTYGYSRSYSNAYSYNPYQNQQYGYSTYGQQQRYAYSRYGQYSEGRRHHRHHRNWREHDRDQNDD